MDAAEAVGGGTILITALPPGTSAPRAPQIMRLTCIATRSELAAWQVVLGSPRLLPLPHYPPPVLNGTSAPSPAAWLSRSLK